jgi:rare lipoprotein A
MRRLMGISFACVVTSACTIGKTPEEESTSRYPGEATGQPQGNGETSTGESACSAEGPITTMSSPIATFERAEPPFAGFEPVADGHDAIPDSCRVWRTTGTTLFGKAAWYNFVGRQTASGEILDTVTATAAHRSLPLASYAKVTNLGNGHAVVVKINDRGPYTRGRILDLSPRAADALDMKHAGVAAVEVEPLVNAAAPTVTVFQTSGTAVSQ